jgi:hypothetical protein
MPGTVYSTNNVCVLKITLAGDLSQWYHTECEIYIKAPEYVLYIV